MDTEVLAALAGKRIEDGSHPVTAIRTVFSEMKGTASVALVHNRGHWLMLATNTGDLYRYADEERGFLLFASERFILSQVVAGLDSSFQADPLRIAWLRPGLGVVVDLRAFKGFDFPLAQEPGGPLPSLPEPQAEPIAHRHVTVEQPAAPFVHAAHADESLLRYNATRVRALRRCSRCILPETFPFIEYDEQGVCNYCRHYRPRLQQDREKSFIEQLQQYRSRDGSPDALVAFSGGRDSSYGLHLIKKEFGLSPITFTYDWGMVTDLARRNVARICGRLGIQNILVSADIRQKRENIRKNVAAWLRKPSLGIVPLFMAGDKYFFRQSNIIKRQTGIRLEDLLPAGMTYSNGTAKLYRPFLHTNVFLDQFDLRQYDNSDGNVAWSGPWTEVGEDGNPQSGNIQIAVDNGSVPGQTYALRTVGTTAVRRA